ncbi:MAG: DUF6701 domain-containing protein [Steroidobacteraceae bacterium]
MLPGPTRRPILLPALLLMVLVQALAAMPALAQTYTRQSVAWNWVDPTSHATLASWDGSLGCIDSVGDDSLSARLSLGFTFKFGSTNYTRLRVMTNGRLQFGTSYCSYGTQSEGPPRTYPDGYATSNLNASMKIYGADLEVSHSGRISYATVGSAPSRKFVVTWTDVPQWNATGSKYNLQVQVAEDGSFYYMYGSAIDTLSGHAIGPAEVGWQLTTGDYAIVQSGLPANGTAWRFVPPGTMGLKISYSSSGLFCLDHTVTITSIDGFGNPTTGYTGTVDLTTTTGKGSWLLSAGGGTLTDSVADDGAATYAWNPASSTVTLALRYRTGGAVVTVNAADQSVPSIRDDGSQGSITFAPSGFTVTSAPLATPVPATIPAFTSPQTAGNNFDVAITAYGQVPNDSTCGVITSYTGTKSLKFWSGYVNPASGTIHASIDGTSIATAEAGAAAQNVTFSSGRALVTGRYRDAGSLSISMKDDTTGNPLLPNGIRGTTGTFVSTPAAFLVSGIKRSSDNFANPAASTAGGTVFIAAGRPFTATITAVDSGGAATPNFGHESPAESVRLDATLVLPASGHAPGVSGSPGTFTNGVATGTAFSWPEVGIAQFVPHVADGSYLGAGDVVGTATGNVGRFIPEDFGVALNTPVFGTACAAGGYTYVGQPFVYTVAPVITVSARAYGGATTQNYTGSLFRLTNASLTGRSYTPTPASPALDTSGLPASTADPAIVDLANGTGTLTFSAGSGLAYQRAAAIAPFDANIALSINVIDLDGATAANPVTFGAGSGIAFSVAATQRYGRLALRNAAGSELLDLPASMTTQYYLGAAQGFTTNTADSCSTAPTLAFSNWQKSLGAGETCVRDSGAPGSSGIGCAAPAAVGSRLRRRRSPATSTWCWRRRVPAIPARSR